jgi:hypothetical protein
MAWYVDEQGEVWSASKLRRALRTDLDDSELSTYLVVNMGYIAFELSPRALWIRLRPCAVTQVTLAGALFWLSERSDSRVVIDYYETTWCQELLGRTSQALGRLAELVVTAPTLRAGDFRRRPRESISGPLRLLVQTWQRDPAFAVSESSMEFLRNGLGGRYMLLKCPQGSRRLEICAVGRGYLSFDIAWLRKAVGRRFDDQPDHLFGRWAAEAYYEAAKGENAIIDDVDVLLDNPRRKKSRLQYQRVILPYRTRSGDHLFLSCSRLDRSIDLRREAD